LNLRSIFLIVSLALFASCASSPEVERREAAARQVEVLRELEARKALIRDRALTHAIVKSARVLFAPGAVIVEIRIRSDRELPEEVREDFTARLLSLRTDLNRFIRETTGHGKEKISLRVGPAG